MEQSLAEPWHFQTYYFESEQAANPVVMLIDLRVSEKLTGYLAPKDDLEDLARIIHGMA